MTRKTFFPYIFTTCLTWITGGCSLVLATVSRWSWPGYPRESELRRHLMTSPNHRVPGKPDFRGMGFDEMVRWHDRDHGVRRGDKPRWTSARWVPGTDKKFSGEVRVKTAPVDTVKTDNEDAPLMGAFR